MLCPRTNASLRPQHVKYEQGAVDAGSQLSAVPSNPSWSHCSVENLGGIINTIHFGFDVEHLSIVIGQCLDCLSGVIVTRSNGALGPCAGRVASFGIPYFWYSRYTTAEFPPFLPKCRKAETYCSQREFSPLKSL